ncbi:hypothetical protein SAMN05444920_102225 [Nonomuraea solani]|uniref:Uncharacterized protein n=2 Tax=Nonomuraea solani TaxID=1144553 RepID=A0A1H5YBZ7_9ACTN|nr:hypothetical protein SAMN05444920_102225 [Nonomuraea solani]
MAAMSVIPASAKTFLRQRLREHARKSWPQLAMVYVRFRASYGYVSVKLIDGDVLPSMRLRYDRSADRWGVAIYSARKGGYEDQLGFTGSPEDSLDFMCDPYLTKADR